MPDLVNAFDSYERKARLYPMLLVLLPAVLGAASWLPTGVDIEALLGGTVTSVVLAAFLGQVARDQGKKREPELFRAWGGKPSVRALSYEGQFFDAKTLRRIHRSINGIDSELRFPKNAIEEAAERDAAFTSYESASELLLSQTRDLEKFRLVFSENVNYGYRRNLWAMKWPGLLLSILGVMASILRLSMMTVTESSMVWVAIISGLVGVFICTLWITRVTSDWVRVAADSYARQLCLASQLLGKT